MRFSFYAIALLLVVSAHSAIAQEPVGNINIIPAPNSIHYSSGTFTFSRKTRIYTENKQDKAFLLFSDLLKKRTGYSNISIEYNHRNLPNSGNALVIEVSAAGELPAEAYKITINKTGVVIRGRGAGLFYGYQSFLQLFHLQKTDTYAIPCLKIEDQPRFGYRGLMLDVARHFYSVEQVKRIIDLMSVYKLNTFHWHLIDSEGWRIEIKKYPRLTSVGAFRNDQVMFGRRELLDTTRYGGYYTQEEIRSIVKYAMERHITIIPEIEMPAHSYAALRSYPEYKVPKPSHSADPGAYEIIFNPSPETFKFLEDVLTEVIALFPGKQIHIGGDEANKIPWQESPYTQQLMKDKGLKNVNELQSYFIRRIERFLNKKGKSIIGWDEILDGGGASTATIMSWRGEEGGLAAVKLKQNVIMVPLNKGLYLDFNQSGSSQEPFNIGGKSTLSEVYHYDPVPEQLNVEERKYIIGVQANLWTEHIGTNAKMEYMLFPRVLALSEIAWTVPVKKNYNRFSKNALPLHLAMLEKRGVNFRVPTAFDALDTTMIGERFSISLNTGVTGSKIYYTINGLTPSDVDFEYRRPLEFSVPVNEKRELKTITITPTGRRSLVTTTILHNRLPLPALAVSDLERGLRYKLFKGAYGSVEEFKPDQIIGSGVAADIVLDQFKKDYDLFGLVYDGYIQIDSTGVYSFSAVSDDGMKLYIDDQLVIDHDFRHGATEKEGSVPLSKGFHKIKIKYFDAAEACVLKLFMRFNNGARLKLPSDKIFHAKADLSSHSGKTGAETTFKNPVSGGADPWITKSGKYYYMCVSNGNINSKGISVSRSEKLTQPGKSVTVWTAPDSGWNSTQIWAPELHRFKNKWYIYYAAGKQPGAPYIHQRSGVLESVTDDPQGRYIDKGMLMTGIDKNDSSGTIWSIDVNVASINGKMYAVWSGWESNATTDKTEQHLYIAAMKNPWTISSKRVKISSPDQPWEQGGPLNLNEGPQFLMRNNQVFIIYSTRESWTPEYRLGQLTLKDVSKSPLDPDNWIKKGPVFQRTQNVFGTGHASFTSSPDGKESWIIYHAKRNIDPGWERYIMMQKFNWNTDGSPDFGIPEDVGKPLEKPSGE